MIWRVLLVIMIASFAFAQDNNRPKRDFPGAEDHDELKVQSELPPPPLKLDRRTLEQKALQGLLKTSDTAGATAEKPAPKR